MPRSRKTQPSTPEVSPDPSPQPENDVAEAVEDTTGVVAPPEPPEPSELDLMKAEMAKMKAELESAQAESKAAQAGFVPPPVSAEPAKMPQKLIQPASAFRTKAQDADPNLRWRDSGSSFGHYQRVR